MTKSAQNSFVCMIPIGHEFKTTNYKSDGYMELLIHNMMVLSSPSSTNIYLG